MRGQPHRQQLSQRIHELLFLAAGHRPCLARKQPQRTIVCADARRATRPTSSIRACAWRADPAAHAARCRVVVGWRQRRPRRSAVRCAGEAGTGTTRREIRESRRRATTTRPVRAASEATARSPSVGIEISKSRDCRNPAQPSATQEAPQVVTANRSVKHSTKRSANRSANHGANSEQTPRSPG